MYKENLEKLFNRFSECLPEECLVLWNATLPISKDARGGFIVPEIEFMNSTLRLDILEANFYARQIVASHGYDFLDLHYYLRNQLHRRVSDGIHWDMTAHRRITNLMLTHLAEAWDEETPGRVHTLLPPDRFNNTFHDNLSKRPPVATVSPINFGVTRTIINENRNQRVQNSGAAAGFHWKPYANNEYQPPNRNRQKYRTQPYQPPFQSQHCMLPAPFM